jgi:hypothetical protein
LLLGQWRLDVWMFETPINLISTQTRTAQNRAEVRRRQNGIAYVNLQVKIVLSKMVQQHRKLIAFAGQKAHVQLRAEPYEIFVLFRFYWLSF